MKKCLSKFCCCTKKKKPPKPNDLPSIYNIDANNGLGFLNFAKMKLETSQHHKHQCSIDNIDNVSIDKNSTKTKWKLNTLNKFGLKKSFGEIADDIVNNQNEKNDKKQAEKVAMKNPKDLVALRNLYKDTNLRNDSMNTPCLLSVDSTKKPRKNWKYQSTNLAKIDTNRQSVVSKDNSQGMTKNCQSPSDSKQTSSIISAWDFSNINSGDNDSESFKKQESYENYINNLVNLGDSNRDLRRDSDLSCLNKPSTYCFFDTNDPSCHISYSSDKWDIPCENPKISDKLKVESPHDNNKNTMDETSHGFDRGEFLNNDNQEQSEIIKWANPFGNNTKILKKTSWDFSNIDKDSSGAYKVKEYGNCDNTMANTAMTKSSHCSVIPHSKFPDSNWGVNASKNRNKKNKTNITESDIIAGTNQDIKKKITKFKRNQISQFSTSRKNSCRSSFASNQSQNSNNRQKKPEIDIIPNSQVIHTQDASKINLPVDRSFFRDDCMDFKKVTIDRESLIYTNRSDLYHDRSDFSIDS